jgi:putative Mn2+ efflux pump MntP
MIDVFLLAMALSMDTFAVSIGLGSKHKIPQNRLALMAGAYFGTLQALMVLIGYLGGKGISTWVTSYAPLVTCVLLSLIGAKMIYESFATGIEDDIKNITHRIMLMLAIGTSMDAMAAGFSLTLMKISPMLASLVIGIITWFFSYIGVIIGTKNGTKLEGKAELFGGVVLILIGLKALRF